MSIWIKLAAAMFVLALAGGLVYTYHSTATQNGELKTQLSELKTNYDAVKKQVDAQDQKMSDLASTLTEHNDKIAALDAAMQTKHTYAAKVYKEAPDATRSVLDTDLPQFKCLYTKTGCEAGPPAVPDNTGGH